MADLDSYKCWVFDCDGVLLDSNQVKSDAFFQTALPYGEEAATKLLHYHQTYGGVSRFRKFEYLFSDILNKSDFQPELEDALNRFAKISYDGILSVAKAPGLGDLLDRIRGSGAQLFVVSGGMQSELRNVFRKRGLDKYFNEIFGSPDTKDQILEREFANGTMTHPAVFLGDSRYDYEISCNHGLEFIFASQWSEFVGWQQFFSGGKVKIINTVGELFKQ